MSAGNWGLTALVIMMGLAGCGKNASLETAGRLEADGKYAQAVTAYQGYLTRNPSQPWSARVAYRMAKSLEQTGNYEKAIEAYRQVVAQ